MCGRFYLPSKSIDTAIAFLSPELQAKAREAIAEWKDYMNQPGDGKPGHKMSRGFNDAAPTQFYPIIRANEVKAMRWGFKTDKSNAVFNARAESMHYPLWRECLVLRRALVVVGGFFEWTGDRKAGPRQPHAIHRHDGEPMILAALWDDDMELGECFSIVTTTPSPWMSKLHDRMPLVLEPEQAATWIDLTQKPPAIKQLIAAYSGKLDEFECATPKQGTPPKPGKIGGLF